LSPKGFALSARRFSSGRRGENELGTDLCIGVLREYTRN
jgi:hypothetical protein